MGSWDWKGTGSGAMSGASTGAMLGPWGAAAGGVLGGVLGGAQGLKGEDAPPPVDFNQAALNTSMGSRPNTSNALGGQTWTTGPDGRPVSSTQFTGQAGDAFQGLLGNMTKAANYDPTQARNQAIQSNFDQGWSRLSPMQAMDQQRFKSDAANSGLGMGSQPYNAGAGLLQRGQTDQFNSLMNSSIGQGNATQQTQMNQMNQPFSQATSMMNMLNQQAPNYGKGPDYLAAAGMEQKTRDNAADRAAAGSAGKKGGAGSLIGGAGGKKGGDKGKAAPNNDYSAASSGGTWV